MSAGPLKLAAMDEADLGVLAAALQDALVKVADLAFDPKGRRFAARFNRYRWEAARERRAGERVQALLVFEHVQSAQTRRLRREAKDAVASLLHLRFEPDAEPPGGVVLFEFAGGGDLRLSVEALEARLEDISSPWPAARRPTHEGS